MSLPLRPTRAVGLLAILAVVAIAVSVLLLLWDLRQRAVAHDASETAALSRVLAAQTAQTLDRTDAMLRAVQERLQAPFIDALSLDGMPMHLLLGGHMHGVDAVNALFIVDPQGQVVSSTRSFPAPALSVADRGYFKAFADQAFHGLLIDTPVQSRINGRWTLNMARALRAPNGKLRGILVAAVDVQRFSAQFGFVVRNFGHPVALYMDDGRLLAALPARDANLGRRPPEMRQASVPAPGRVAVLAPIDADNSGRVIALTRLPGLPMMVGVTDDTARALAAWRATALPIAVGALLVCAFLGTAAALLAGEVEREERLARALREANDRWRRTIDSVLDAIVSVDADQNIIMFNPAAEAMFGLSHAQALGKPLAALIPERLRAGHHAHVESFIESGATSREMAPQMEVMGLRADGTEFAIESTISRTEIDGAPQLTAVLRDVTERRRRESEQMAMNEELRRLSTALQSVREEERARISRELHDDLGQQLTGIRLDLSRLVSRIKDGRAPAPDTLDSMRTLLDGAIGAVRRISTELRPRMLDDLGFEEAVAWQAGEFTRRSGVRVRLDLEAAGDVHGDALSTALFRIVQEALTNVARHAHASEVHVALHARGDTLALRIVDDGNGIDIAQRSHGIGLLGMRERATALGGRFTIARDQGGGTRVEVDIPLSPQHQGDPA